MRLLLAALERKEGVKMSEFDFLSSSGLETVSDLSCFCGSLPDTLEEEGSPRSSKKVVKKRKVDA